MGSSSSAEENSTSKPKAQKKSTSKPKAQKPLQKPLDADIERLKAEDAKADAPQVTPAEAAKNLQTEKAAKVTLSLTHQS